jgi:hypothetical protein
LRKIYDRLRLAEWRSCGKSRSDSPLADYET